MQIKNIITGFDDNDTPIYPGDKVMIQTSSMQDLAYATISEITMSTITVIVDDKLIGHRPIKSRKDDVIQIIKYT